MHTPPSKTLLPASFFASDDSPRFRRASNEDMGERLMGQGHGREESEEGDSTWQTYDVSDSEYEEEEPIYEHAGAWLVNAGAQTTQGLFNLR